MPIKTVAAHSEVVRRLGLGVRQCAECRWAYSDGAIPEECVNPECGSYDRTRNYDVVYHVSAEEGRAVELALKAYSTLLHGWEDKRPEADRIWELAKLFE